MKVFVAGASGVIGRPLVPPAGRGGTRGHRDDQQGRERAADRGGRGEAVVCDALDPEAVEAAVREAGPEVVISQLTRLPREYNPRKIDYGPDEPGARPRAATT